MALLRRSDEVPAGLSAILLSGERLVTAVHSHWARLAKPAAISLGVLIVTIFVDSNLTAATEGIGNALWVAWFISLAWLGWQVLEWRHDWFVATDKRLLMRYGIITHRVAMMPLIKVTDMSYVRSIPGQFLGYGRFIMESAGQDQAMRTVEWVPHPDKTYRLICAEIFHIVPPAPGEPVLGEPPQFEDGGDGSDGTPGHPEDPYPDVQPIHNPVQDRLGRYSRAIPIRRRRGGGESLYESEDLQRLRRLSAETGPIPLSPRHEPRTD